MINKITDYLSEKKHMIFWFFFGIGWSYIITEFTTIPAWVSIVSLAVLIVIVEAVRKNV